MKLLKFKYAFLLILFYAIQGCFPEDKRVIPLDLELVEIPYSMYDTQSWFNLHDNTIVSHNSFLDWDLGFQSDGNGHHIILNTSRFMHAGNTGSTDFSGITTNICDTMIYDDSDGDPEKTAIGEWADFSDPSNPVYPGNVYILDLGTDNNGLPYGFKKITFDGFLDNRYSVHFSNLDGSDEHFSEVVTDPDRSYTLFSFDNGGTVVPLQPPDTGWDLCFTQYSTILFDDNNVATPYLVRGVYLNMKGTMAARDTTGSFSGTGLGDIAGYTFSGSQDAIGYEWKDYNDDAYKINPDIFYIVKSQLGEYYKIKFAGFYNSSGEKGYPSFQCIRITD